MGKWTQNTPSKPRERESIICWYQFSEREKLESVQVLGPNWQLLLGICGGKCFKKKSELCGNVVPILKYLFLHRNEVNPMPCALKCLIILSIIYIDSNFILRFNINVPSIIYPLLFSQVLLCLSSIRFMNKFLHLHFIGPFLYFTIDVFTLNHWNQLFN